MTAAAIYGVNLYVVATTKDQVAGVLGADGYEEQNYTAAEIRDKQLDCILVLGAGLSPDGSPSPMLRDRLDLGIYLYKEGYAPKILLSGDNGQVEYNEIRAMLDYVRAADVPEEDIFCDYAGFSTYDSMYRAKEIFHVQGAIVVTQSYHLYRALYIAEALDMDVAGAAADQKRYHGQSSRDFREILARDKDFFKCFSKPEAQIMGDTIDIKGNGRQLTWENMAQ